MNGLRWMLAVATLAVQLPAQAAVGDPELILYRFPGLRDSGDAPFQGVATSFHCTNFSGVTETIRFVTRNFNGALLTNNSFNIGHLATLTVSTHATQLFSGSTIGTGFVAQGTTAIAATSINVICTAMIVDAASFTPVGIALHGVRFNPAPGSQE